MSTTSRKGAKAQKVLKPYIVSDSSGGASRDDVAILVFHFSAKEARKLGWPTMRSFCDTEWINCTVCALKLDPWIMRQAVKDVPHVIDNPDTCPRCERWGGQPLGNHCAHCHDPEVDGCGAGVLLSASAPLREDHPEGSR